MKKITLLLSFVACVVFAQAQTNLLVNPSFETWTAGKPDSWIFDKTTATLTQSTTTPSETGSALQVAATGTYWVTQLVTAPNTTFETSKKYEFSLKYKITAGDKTDFRIWHGFLTSDPGTTAAYYPIPTTTADSATLYWPFHGPDGKSATTGYWSYDSADQNWKTYSYEFNFPEGIKQFSYQLRVYSNATVILDDLYFGESRLSNVFTPSVDMLNVTVAGKTLTVANASTSTVEIFSTLGAKVQTTELVNGSAELNLAKGLYIVRIGNKSAKVRL